MSRLRNPVGANSPRETASRRAMSSGSARRSRTHATLAVDHGPGDCVEESGARGGVVDGGQGVEVGLVGALGDLGTAMEVGDALAQRAPGERALGIVVGGTQDLEVAGI